GNRVRLECTTACTTGAQGTAGHNGEDARREDEQSRQDAGPLRADVYHARVSFGSGERDIAATVRAACIRLVSAVREADAPVGGKLGIRRGGVSRRPVRRFPGERQRKLSVLDRIRESMRKTI